MTTKQLKIAILPTPEGYVYEIYLRCQKISSIIVAWWGPALQVVGLISFVSLQQTAHIKSTNISYKKKKST
jgi:hypothetical protein